jgi:hypothetical protein
MRHFLHSKDSPAQFSRFLNALLGDHDPRANIIASAAETAGFWPDLKRHAHFSTHSPSYKSEGFSVHLCEISTYFDSRKQRKALFDENKEKLH